MAAERRADPRRDRPDLCGRRSGRWGGTRAPRYGDQCRRGPRGDERGCDRPVLAADRRRFAVRSRAPARRLRDAVFAFGRLHRSGRRRSFRGRVLARAGVRSVAGRTFAFGERGSGRNPRSRRRTCDHRRSGREFRRDRRQRLHADDRRRAGLALRHLRLRAVPRSEYRRDVHGQHVLHRHAELRTFRQRDLQRLRGDGLPGRAAAGRLPCVRGLAEAEPLDCRECAVYGARQLVPLVPHGFGEPHDHAAPHPEHLEDRLDDPVGLARPSSRQRSGPCASRVTGHRDEFPFGSLHRRHSNRGRYRRILRRQHPAFVAGPRRDELRDGDDPGHAVGQLRLFRRHVRLLRLHRRDALAGGFRGDFRRRRSADADRVLAVGHRAERPDAGDLRRFRHGGGAPRRRHPRRNAGDGLRHRLGRRLVAAVPGRSPAGRHGLVRPRAGVRAGPSEALRRRLRPFRRGGGAGLRPHDRPTGEGLDGACGRHARGRRRRDMGGRARLRRQHRLGRGGRAAGLGPRDGAAGAGPGGSRLRPRPDRPEPGRALGGNRHQRPHAGHPGRGGGRLCDTGRNGPLHGDQCLSQPAHQRRRGPCRDLPPQAPRRDPLPHHLPRRKPGPASTG